MKKIYCIGGATIDRKLKLLHELHHATSNPVTSCSTFGGVARNIAENLANWTTEIFLQTVISDDNDGIAILRHLNKLNINTTACFTVKNCPTAHYYAIVLPNGELHNAFADMEIFNHVTPEDLSPHWSGWEESNIVFLDTNLPTVVIHTAIEALKKKMTMCVDPVSVVKAKKLPKNLENIFLLKPNRQEVEALSGIKVNSIHDSKIAGIKLLMRGVENVVISLGKAGYTVVNEAEQIHFPATPINVIQDVNGAGDAFMAGILLGLQKSKDLLYGCELGANAANFVLQSEHSVAKNISLTQLTGA